MKDFESQKNLGESAQLDMVEVHSSTLCRPTKLNHIKYRFYKDFAVLPSLSISYLTLLKQGCFPPKRCGDGVNLSVRPPR